MNHRRESNALRLSLVVLAAGLSTALSGCAVSSLSTAGAAASANSLPVIQGRVHGGQQPIAASTIQLWQAGKTGYGSAATKLLTTTVTTSDGTGTVDSNSNVGNLTNTLPAGSFTITGDYTCTGDTFLYITATGGNPGAGVNSAVQLVAPLGACTTLTASTYIVINELTTAAAAFALGQYFTPTYGTASADSFGAPNTTQGQLGLTDAFATVNSLVSVGSGNAQTSLTLTGAGLSVTATPESAKLITVADILAACVNSASSAASNCTTLFNSVAPAGATAPTDTLQAAVYMSLNPTSNNANGSTTNLTNLYALLPATPAFAGAVSAQPTDWTIGIAYVDTTANTFLTEPQNLAVDSLGNIWVTNIAGVGGLAEVSPTGTPMASVLTSATAGSGINGASPRNMAIDTANNIWVTTSTSAAYIYEYSAGTVSNYSTSKSSYGLAIDGSNNVYVGTSSASAHFGLYEFPGGNIATPIVFPIATATPGVAGVNGTASYLLPEYLAVDTAGNVWITSGGSSSSSTANAVVELTNINITACVPYTGTAPCPAGSTTGTPLATSTTMNTYTTLTPSAAALSGTWGLAANSNGMWVANEASGTNTVSVINNAGTTGSTYGSVTSLNAPHYLAVDGSGNVWASNKVASPGSVSEVSLTGTVLSAINSGTAPFNTVGYSHAGISTNLGIAIDPSGNVWVANNVVNTGGIFEIVGAAAPTVTPIALALKNGTVGAKP